MELQTQKLFYLEGSKLQETPTVHRHVQFFPQLLLGPLIDPGSPNPSISSSFWDKLKDDDAWHHIAAAISGAIWWKKMGGGQLHPNPPAIGITWLYIADIHTFVDFLWFFPIQALQAKLTQAKVFGQHAGWETILQLPLSSHPTLLATFSGDMSAWLSIETRGRNKPQIRLFFRLFLHTPWFSRVVSRMHLFPGPACHINDDEKQQQGPGQCFEGTHDAWTHQTNVNQPTSLATVWSWVINSSICSFHG